MFDHALIHGIVIDGSGDRPRRANVYISGGRVARVCESILPAAEVFDASEHIICPGFIDIHTHSDLTPYGAPQFESYVHQGVTTCLCGNCGTSFVPHSPPEHEPKLEQAARTHFPGGLSWAQAMDTAAYLEEITGRCANNVGTFVGHGALRNMCMENPRADAPTPDELVRMQALLRRELEAGAFGLSLGLIYVPGIYAGTEELIALARIAAEYGAVVPIHMRSEAAHVFKAVREVGRIGLESGAHVHISHFKIMDSGLWGQADALLALADDFIARGVRLDFDQYPYLASATPLSSCLPGHFLRLSHEAQRQVLADPKQYRQLVPEIESDPHFSIGADRVLVTSTSGFAPAWDGRFLSDIAEELDVAPVEAYRRVMLASDLTASGCYFTMHRPDALRIAMRDDVSVVSDSTAVDMFSHGMVGVPHPRTSGAFVRFLRMNRKLGLMPLEKAVHKMTGLPAHQMNIAGRGLLREGFRADVVVFDPQTVSDCGTYADPAQTAVGIDRVMLNGAWIRIGDRFTGLTPGQGLRRGIDA